MKIYSTVFFICITSFSFAQKPSDFAYLNAKYTDEDGVFLQMHESAEIKIENDSLKIYNHVLDELYMLKDNTAAYAEKKIAYSGFIQINELKPLTLVASGDKYKESVVTNVKDVDDMSDGVFYDDTRYKSFIFPSLTKGNIAQLNYVEKYNEPRFLSPFYFNSYCPVVKSTYSITFPASVKVSYKLMGADTDKIKVTKIESKGNSTYIFEAQNLDKWEYEGNAPPLSGFNPHVIIFIEEATINGKKYTYLKDVASLYNWYYSLTEHVNENPDAQLVNLVSDLTKDKTSEIDKVKSIFYWVQDNVKYIAFEAGLEGFVPREASAVCNKKYGDCKDMASIISSMLQIAGIDGHMVWIGTRDIGYTYSEVPSPLCDNHMIAAYNDNGNWVYLDGTGEYLSYGYPTDMVQGKQAIIGMGKDKYQLVTVPVVPKELNSTNTNISIVLDGNEVKGNAVTAFYGFPKFYKIFSLRSTPETKWNELMKTLLGTGNNKFQVTHYTITGKEKREDTLNFSYTFTIPDYIKKLDDEYYINMNLDKTWSESQINIEQRKLPIEHDYLFENKNDIALTIPAGYTVSYIPEDATYTRDAFGFTIHYSLSGNKIIMQKKIWINALELGVGEFAMWNDMVKKINDAYKEVIVLKQNS